MAYLPSVSSKFIRTLSLPIRGGYLAGWFDAKDRWPAEIERRAGSLPMVAESGRGPTEIIPTVPF